MKSCRALLKDGRIALSTRLKSCGKVAELDELCPGSAILILSANLDMANPALARRADADEILDKLAAPEETINRPPRKVQKIRRLGDVQGCGRWHYAPEV